MRGQIEVDGRILINFEEALARFGLAREQLYYILNHHAIPSRGPMLTEGPGGSQGPEDYYDAQELETAVKRYKQEMGLEQSAE